MMIPVVACELIDMAEGCDGRQSSGGCRTVGEELGRGGRRGCAPEWQRVARSRGGGSCLAAAARDPVQGRRDGPVEVRWVGAVEGRR